MLQKVIKHKDKSTAQMISFVGREIELQCLQQALNKVLSNQTPAFVLIQGDFGVGKTSLVNHFIEEVTKEQPSYLIEKGICASETELSGLVPFGQLLEQLAKGKGTATSLTDEWMGFIRKVAPAWLDIFTLGAASATVKTIEEGGKLFGKSGYKQEHIFIQFTNALMKLAEKQPLLAFLDDLQWADASSLDLLSHLSRNLHERAILFICTYRPEARETSPNADKFNELRARIIRYEIGSEIDLRQGIDVRKYVDKRYLYHKFPSDFLARVQEITEGHPLFVSQLFSLWQEVGIITATPEHKDKQVWILIEKKQIDITIPQTIQVVLEQRMRLMGEELRKISISASVEGEEFTAQVVAHLTKSNESDMYDHLDTLEDRYWLVQEKETKELGDIVLDTYQFTHRFFRDYIYNQLHSGKRRLLHKAVGECLEMLYNNNLYPIAGQLTLHFREARSARKAASYALMAAQFEQSRYAWKEAEDWCKSGLKLIENKSNDIEVNKLKIDLFIQLGYSYYEPGKFPQAEQCYQTALTLSQEIGAKAEQLAKLYIELADTCRSQGQLNEVIKFVKQAKIILDENKGTIPYSELHVKLGWVHAVTQRRLGNTESAIELFSKLLTDSEELPFTSTLGIIQAHIYRSLGFSLSILNRYDEAILNRQKAIELAIKLDDKALQANFMVSLSNDYYFIGQFEKGIALVSEAFQIASQIGDLNTVQYSKNVKGLLFLSLGKISEAIKELEEAKSIVEQIGSNWIIPSLFADIGSAYLASGDIEKACKYAFDSFAEAEKSKRPFAISYSLDMVGRVEIAQKNFEKAANHFKQAITLYNQIGNRHFVARTQYHLADALFQQGKSEETESLVRQALETFQELKLNHEIVEMQKLCSWALQIIENYKLLKNKRLA